MNIRVEILEDCVRPLLDYTSTEGAHTLFTDVQWRGILEDYDCCTARAFQKSYIDVVKEKYYPILRENTAPGGTLSVEVFNSDYSITLYYTKTGKLMMSARLSSYVPCGDVVEVLDGGLLGIVAKHNLQKATS